MALVIGWCGIWRGRTPANLAPPVALGSPAFMLRSSVTTWSLLRGATSRVRLYIFRRSSQSTSSKYQAIFSCLLFFSSVVLEAQEYYRAVDPSFFGLFVLGTLNAAA